MKFNFQSSHITGKVGQVTGRKWRAALHGSAQVSTRVSILYSQYEFVYILKPVVRWLPVGQMYVLWGNYMTLYRNIDCSGVGGMFRLCMCTLAVYGTARGEWLLWRSGLCSDHRSSSYFSVLSTCHVMLPAI